MAAYDKQAYLDQVKQVRAHSWKLSFAPIDELQAFSLGLSDPENLPDGISKPTFKAHSEQGPVEALIKAIDGLKQDRIDYVRPEAVDVPSEISSPPADSSSKGAPTLLFVHGGGFIYGSPGTARRSTKRLSTLCGAKCITPQYRKCPTSPFPAAILDVFCVYLSLLSPAPGSFNEQVAASKLVFAGESSGLNLLMALVQVILYLRQHGSPTVSFHGRDVKLELPAAVTGICGFFDVTCGLPSWSKHADRDVLPKVQPTYTADWEDQKLWPADPPRADLYCERSAMSHPLLSPVTAASWQGAPPLFLAVGDEMNLDSNLYLAQLAAAQGVPVHFSHYSETIHVWSTSLPKLPHSAHVMEAWAKFILQITTGERIQSEACLLLFDTLESKPLDITKLTHLTRDDILRLTAKAQQERLLVSRKNKARM